MSFEIQKQTLTDVCEKLAKYHKCAILRPTGFGKTYMLTELISKYAKVLYIYPAAVVRDTVVENYYTSDQIDYFDENGNVIDPESLDMLQEAKKIPNCDLMTYTKLSKLDKKKIKAMPQYNLIIFDEMHRMGAKKTCAACNQLLADQTHADIVGATATPTRMDNIDPVSIFFSDIMAYSYTLVDAINDGIIKKPNYCYCTYDFQSDLEEYALEAGEDIKDTEIKRVLQAHVIEMADIFSMDKVIRRTCDEYAVNTSYMKFIAFFSTKMQIDEQLAQIQKWFHKAYPKHKIQTLTITSRGTEHKNTDKLKDMVRKPHTIDLIACIDMLNMGYHVNDLTGILMYRGTKSNTIFTQQLGRALSVGTNNSAIVFDVVDNLHRKAIYDLKRSFTKKPLRRSASTPDHIKEALTGYVLHEDKVMVEHPNEGLIPTPYHLDQNNEIVDHNGVPSTLKYDLDTNMIYDAGVLEKDINTITKECLHATGNEAMYREIIAKAVAEPLAQRCKAALELHFRTWCRNNKIPYPISDAKLQRMYKRSKEDFYKEFADIIKNKQINYPLQDAEKLLYIGTDDNNVPLEICAKARNVSINQILNAFGI